VTVSAEKNEIKIFSDTERSLPVIDPNQRESYISIGAFLENMSEAFEIYGYHIELTLNDNENDSLCATVVYEKTSSSIDESSTSIFKRRHSNKSAFKTDEISDNIIDNLLEKHGDYLRYYPAGSDDGQYISNATLTAYTQQANEQNARDELADWLRFSNSEAKEKKDGLPAEQLGLRGIVKVFYYLTTNRESSKGDTFAGQGVDKTKAQLSGCAGFFLITGRDGKEDWIEAGMHLEAFWLDAVRHNIAIQPMSAALEETPYCDEISDKFGADGKVQMILRAGLVDDYGENAGIRRDLKEFVYLEK